MTGNGWERLTELERDEIVDMLDQMPRFDERDWWIAYVDESGFRDMLESIRQAKQEADDGPVNVA